MPTRFLGIVFGAPPQSCYPQKKCDPKDLSLTAKKISPWPIFPWPGFHGSLVAVRCWHVYSHFHFTSFTKKNTQIHKIKASVQSCFENILNLDCLNGFGYSSPTVRYKEDSLLPTYSYPSYIKLPCAPGKLAVRHLAELNVSMDLATFCMQTNNANPVEIHHSQSISGRWFQSNWKSSPNRGENKKYLKPPVLISCDHFVWRN